MLEAVVNSFKIADLRRKIFFTLGILIIFRIIAHVPVPGINIAELQQVVDNNQLLGLLNLFSGGTLYQFSIVAMGVYPYITASIIMTLLQGIVPRLSELSKEGDSGRATINRITHILTVPLGALQAYGLLRQFASGSAQFGNVQLLNFKFALFDNDFGGALQSWATLIAMTTGTLILVWLGELITEFGIGQGVSIIIFGGIVSRIPTSIQQLFVQTSGVGNVFGLLVFIAIGLVTIIGVVLVNEGQRRIPVNYARTMMRGNRMVRQAGSSFIPLRVNSAGMIPLIFAIAIMVFPSTIAGFFRGAQTEWVRNIADAIYNFFLPQTLQYQVLYFLMVFGFTYLYTQIQFGQQNIAENLMKSGGSVPGVRPGVATERYLNRVLNRITTLGALFLATVAVLPYFASIITGNQGTQTLLSSTALLIVVGVAIDTMKQLEAQLLMRRYEGFIK
jgi:preprotein translocase subunit SecY